MIPYAHIPTEKQHSCISSMTRCLRTTRRDATCPKSWVPQGTPDSRSGESVAGDFHHSVVGRTSVCEDDSIRCHPEQS